jgi:hypothetical protein
VKTNAIFSNHQEINRGYRDPKLFPSEEDVVIKHLTPIKEHRALTEREMYLQERFLRSSPMRFCK